MKNHLSNVSKISTITRYIGKEIFAIKKTTSPNWFKRTFKGKVSKTYYILNGYRYSSLEDINDMLKKESNRSGELDLVRSVKGKFFLRCSLEIIYSKGVYTSYYGSITYITELYDGIHSIMRENNIPIVKTD